MFKPVKFLLTRHGESIWNKQNKFTGWSNVGLTRLGKQHAIQQGKFMYNNNIQPSVIFTSSLSRAINTSYLIRSELRNPNIPIISSWKLNERHYGSLEGIVRSDVEDSFSKEEVFKIRTDFTSFPLEWPISNKIHDFADEDQKEYNNKFVNGESVDVAFQRFLPYYLSTIEPCLDIKNSIPLIVTHKHMCRAIIRYLGNQTPPDEIDNSHLITIKLKKKRGLCYI